MKRAYDSYGEIAFKLRLKPFETLDFALLNAYKYYCIKNKISKEDMIDINEFLLNIRKVYIVVAICDKIILLQTGQVLIGLFSESLFTD